MKLIVNIDNIQQVYACIKVIQSNLKEELRLLEIELTDPLAWTNDNRLKKLEPFRAVRNKFSEVEIILMTLLTKNGKDWHKTRFGHCRDKDIRTAELTKLIEMFESLGIVFTKPKNEIDFQDLRNAKDWELEEKIQRFKYKSTIEEKIAHASAKLEIIAIIESKIVVGLILEESELNLIQFKN